MPRVKKLLLDIHGENIYKGFPAKDFEFNPHSWRAEHPIFKRLIEEVRPKTIIEVGSWMGFSAMIMAERCKELDLYPEIICIDTWLGGIGEVEDENVKALFNRVHGLPNLYYQFLANIIQSGHHDLVIPIPNTSTVVSRMLESLDVHADLIFIDGSHIYEDVLSDVQNYLPLLNEGGVMFGDDLFCPDVQRALDDFCYGMKSPYTHEDEIMWEIRK